MADSSTPRIACPNCGKQYKWKPQIAGRKVQCSACEQKMRLPDNPDSAIEPIGPLLSKKSAESHGAYELDLPDDEKDASSAPAVAPGKTPANCPGCNAKLKPGAVLCINCGYHVAEGKKITTQVAAGGAAAPPTKKRAKKGVPSEKGFTNGGGGGEDAKKFGAFASAVASRTLDSDALAEDIAKEQKRKDFTIPLILIGIALVGLLLNAFGLESLVYDIHVERSHKFAVSMAQSFGGTPPAAPQYGAPLSNAIRILVINAVVLVIQVPLLLLAIFVVARIFGSSFGAISSAILKLLALALFVAMVGECTDSLLDIVTGGFGGLGFWISVSVNFGTFYVLCMWLFEMDPMEAIVMYLIIVLLPILLVTFVIAGLFVAIL